MRHSASARLLLKKSAFLLFLLLTLGVTACDDEQVAPAERRLQQAFDLVSFLNEESEALLAQDAGARKTVSEAGVTKETKTFRTIDWSEELAPFVDADLNKPALAGLFTEEVSTNAAGHQVRRYTPKEDADTNAQEVIYVFDAQGNLLQVDATIVQENMLFQTWKQLHLKTQPGQAPRLVAYRLDETQKLLLMGKEQFGIAGEVTR